RREKETTTESNLAECLQPEGIDAQRAYVPHLNCGKSLSQMTSSPKLCPFSQESNSTVDWTLE
ncbi:hypothetical protein LEMLEM_LOCUS19954, partial [Lemmus lemmus]